MHTAYIQPPGAPPVKVCYIVTYKSCHILGALLQTYRIFGTIEGHASVEVRLKHFAVKTDASVTLSVLTKDGLVSLLKDIIKTLAALLLLPYTVCSHCDTRHRRMRCP